MFHQLQFCPFKMISTSASLSKCIVFSLLTCLMIHSSYCVVIDANNPIVQTQYGQIRGKPFQFSSSINTQRTVVQFIGVPYARPPTGVDRFMVHIFYCYTFSIATHCHETHKHLFYSHFTDY